MAIKKSELLQARAMKKGIPDLLKNNVKKKQEKKINIKSKSALIIEQEIRMARLLSSNDTKVRDKVLKNLKKFLIRLSKISYEFTEEDFMILWKGLFYNMWMADKLLTQEKIAESISKFIHYFESIKTILLYVKAVLKTLGIEWFGIDHFRMDKFSMLTRRIWRQIFKLCHDQNWNMELVRGLMKILQEILTESKYNLGFKMHIVELYWEEVAKISRGKVPEAVVTKLIEPFIAYMAGLGEEKLIKHVMKHIFRYLIFQSDIGMDYKEKFEAWREAGFPCKSINDMQKIEESDEENEENTNVIIEKESTEDTEQQILDPRAGRVDVELPQINFNAKNIAELIKLYKFHPSSSSKSRRQIIRLIDEFIEVSQGKMPIGVQEVETVRKFSSKIDPKKAALRLLKFHKELYSDNNASKRKRKRNEQSDENLMNELEEIDTEKDATLERNNKKLNKKKKLKQDLQNNLDELNETTTDDSPLKDLKINTKNKKKKQKDKLTNDIVHNKKNDVGISIPNKINKFKEMKMKLSSIKDKNTSKKVGLNKLKKLKSNIYGEWDISDCDVTINNNGNKMNNSWNEQFDKWTLNDKTDVTFCKTLPPSNHGLCKSMASTKHTEEQNKLINDLGQKKRVKIVLQRNTAQHTSDYIEQLKQSPAIPFDANKKPLVGVLKASPIPSPINPFYRKINKK